MEEDKALSDLLDFNAMFEVGNRKQTAEPSQEKGLNKNGNEQSRPTRVHTLSANPNESTAAQKSVIQNLTPLFDRPPPSVIVSFSDLYSLKPERQQGSHLTHPLDLSAEGRIFPVNRLSNFPSSSIHPIYEEVSLNSDKDVTNCNKASLPETLHQPGSSPPINQDQFDQDFVRHPSQKSPESSGSPPKYFIPIIGSTSRGQVGVKSQLSDHRGAPRYLRRSRLLSTYRSKRKRSQNSSPPTPGSLTVLRHVASSDAETEPQELGRGGHEKIMRYSSKDWPPRQNNPLSSNFPSSPYDLICEEVPFSCKDVPNCNEASLPEILHQLGPSQSVTQDQSDQDFVRCVRQNSPESSGPHPKNVISTKGSTSTSQVGVKAHLSDYRRAPTHYSQTLSQHSYFESSDSDTEQGELLPDQFSDHRKAPGTKPLKAGKRTILGPESPFSSHYQLGLPDQTARPPYGLSSHMFHSRDEGMKSSFSSPRQHEGGPFPKYGSRRKQSRPLPSETPTFSFSAEHVKSSDSGTDSATDQEEFGKGRHEVILGHSSVENLPDQLSDNREASGCKPQDGRLSVITSIADPLPLKPLNVEERAALGPKSPFSSHYQWEMPDPTARPPYGLSSHMFHLRDEGMKSSFSSPCQHEGGPFLEYPSRRKQSQPRLSETPTFSFSAEHVESSDSGTDSATDLEEFGRLEAPDSGDSFDAALPDLLSDHTEPYYHQSLNPSCLETHTTDTEIMTMNPSVPSFAGSTGQTVLKDLGRGLLSDIALEEKPHKRGFFSRVLRSVSRSPPVWFNTEDTDYGDVLVQPDAAVTAVICPITNTLPPSSQIQTCSSSSPDWSQGAPRSLPRSHSSPSLCHMTSAEKKTLTRACSLPDLLLKTSCEQFTPDISADGDDETYRFQCSSPGLYQCSVTGLMFHMEREGDVIYQSVTWDRKLLSQHHKQPAGPLFDIKCEQQSVCQLHLPHCEIRSTGGGHFLSVAHVNDEGMEFIVPHKITENHVIINVSGFSDFGIVRDEDSPAVPVRALVLLFYQPPVDPNLSSLLNVLMLPRNVVLRDVLRTRKKLVGDECYMETSPHCRLQPQQEYTLSTCPEDDSVLVEPTTAEFDSDNFDNYFPSFQVSLEQPMKHIKLFLKHNDSSHSVWERRVCLQSSGVQRSCGQNARNLPSCQKLFEIRIGFVEGVSGPVLKCLLDKLFEKTVMTDSERESAEAIRDKRDKARFVIDAVRNKGEAASSEMIEALCDLDPFLCEHLGLM